MKKQHDLEKNIFEFVDISHRRYKLRRDVEQIPKRALSPISMMKDIRTSTISDPLIPGLKRAGSDIMYSKYNQLNFLPLSDVRLYEKVPGPSIFMTLCSSQST